jgi:hypothetical protein
VCKGCGHPTSSPRSRQNGAHDDERTVLLQAHCSGLQWVKGEEGEEGENEALPVLDAKGRVAGYAGIDHSVRSFANALPLDAEQRAALMSDCRLVFALNSSNWLAASAEPRCSLEAVARAVFERHTRGATYDATRSGCEWWAQARTRGSHRP